MNERKKYGGRKKGTLNKQTAKIKEVVHSLLADNIDQLNWITGSDNYSFVNTS